MANKKVLIDARMYGLENSGIGRYLINLIKYLTESKNDLQFVVLLKENYFNELKLPENWKKVLADFRHYTFEEQIKLPGIISKEEPSLVHFPHFNTPFFWKGKNVLTIHDLTTQRQGMESSNLPFVKYFLKRITFLIIASNAVKDSMKIITPSDAVKEDVVKYYSVSPSKIKTIYEGVSGFLGDKESKTSNLEILTKYKLKKPYFLYVGNAYLHKNLEKAIEAMALLNKKRSEQAILAIVGSRDVFKKRLEKMVIEHGADIYVKLLGYVPDEELQVLYKSSVAFVYPSLSEGFGLQGLEAMQNNTLLLASDIKVFKEIYKGNAFYFDPKDPASISGAMDYMLNLEKNKKEKFIQKSKEFIKKYSWSKMAKETLSIYESCIGI